MSHFRFTQSAAFLACAFVLVACNHFNPDNGPIRLNQVGYAPTQEKTATIDISNIQSPISNCYIITNDLSGNIAFQVQKNGNGIVLNGEERLVPFLQNEQLLRQKINEYKTSAIKGPNVLRENDNIVGVINDTFGSVESIDRITGDKKKKVSYYNRYKSHYENLEKRRIIISRHYHKLVNKVKK